MLAQTLQGGYLLRFAREELQRHGLEAESLDQGAALSLLQESSVLPALAESLVGAEVQVFWAGEEVLLFLRPFRAQERSLGAPLSVLS